MNGPVLFLLPLGLSVAATIYFLISDEIGLVGKGIAFGLTGVSILLQIVPALEVHFLIPLAMQLIVCFWLVLFQ